MCESTLNVKHAVIDVASLQACRREYLTCESTLTVKHAVIDVAKETMCEHLL